VRVCVFYYLAYNFSRIYVYNGGSLHNNIPEKQNRHYCINIYFIFLLTLHVSALILGHHQAYNDTSPSSSVASYFNMDSFYVLVGFEYIN
jgi:hypothetical protein